MCFLIALGAFQNNFQTSHWLNHTHETLYQWPAEPSQWHQLFTLWLFILIHMYTCVVRLYLLISTMITTWKRLIHIGRVIFCIIGVHILNIIIIHLQMNSNFTFCQKESDEFLYEDFTESKIPDILGGVQPQLYTSSDVFPPLIHFHFIQIIFTGLHFKLAHKKGKESLCWKDLRFMFKFSWNLWEHWGAISHLHWHLISQEESESTNCQGFPMCPIILHQFPWPYGLLVN